MVAIQNFLSSFGELFVSLCNFIIGMFRDIMQMISILARIPDFLLSLFNWMDPAILIYASTLISIVVVYKILGREG